jgi:transposase-like protein
MKKEHEERLEEGDSCPKCKNGMLVINNPSEASGGLAELRCEDCNYDATEDE